MPSSITGRCFTPVSRIRFAAAVIETVGETATTGAEGVDGAIIGVFSDESHEVGFGYDTDDGVFVVKNDERRNRRIPKDLSDFGYRSPGIEGASGAGRYVRDGEFDYRTNAVDSRIQLPYI